MDKSELLSLSFHVEMESKGYVFLHELKEEENLISILVEKKYIDHCFESQQSLVVLSKGQPYLKQHTSGLWIKPHAVNFILSLLDI